MQLPNQRRDWNAYDANHIGAWKFRMIRELRGCSSELRHLVFRVPSVVTVHDNENCVRHVGSVGQVDGVDIAAARRLIRRKSR